MAISAKEWLKTGALLVLCLAAVLVHRAYGASLLHSQYWSGWTLLFVVMFLAIYNFRKKLTYLPFGAASWWLSAHVMAGASTFDQRSAP